MSDESRQYSLESRHDDSRLVPLSIAGVVCFFIAVILGYSGWYFFGSHTRRAAQETPQVAQTSPVIASPPQNTEQKAETSAKPEIFAPQGTVPVSGAQVVLGGESEERPVQRVAIEPFAIAETEVTNEQYLEFTKATGHKTPAHWQNGQFAEGDNQKPVANITWQDAKDYCKWLSEKIGATVRLPSEAEWELAARGKEGLNYPWGNSWDGQAAASKETAGKVQPVKTFAANKSPFGAYDMAGNVWEWVEETARDANGKTKISEGVELRIIKGGAADEPEKYISATARMEVPTTIADRAIGFRYVVVRENKKEESNKQTSKEEKEKKAEDKNVEGKK